MGHSSNDPVSAVQEIPLLWNHMFLPRVKKQDLPLDHMLSYFLGPFAKLRKATISFVMSAHLFVRPSVRPSTWNYSAPNGRIFMKFDFRGF
jgi:hypothetical protein